MQPGAIAATAFMGGAALGFLFVVVSGVIDIYDVRVRTPTMKKWSFPGWVMWILWGAFVLCGMLALASVTKNPFVDGLEIIAGLLLWWGPVWLGRNS